MKKDKFGEEYFVQVRRRYSVKRGDSRIYGDVPYNKALLRLILECKNSGKLLEIGCAYSYFLRHTETY